MPGNKLRQHGGNIKEVIDRFGAKNYLDFSANINPLGLAPAVAEAIRTGISEIVNYPEPDAGALNQEVAAYLDADPRMVACGNGASELIYLLVRLLEPKRVVIPQPTFSEYQLAAETVKAEILSVPLSRQNGFRWNIGALTNVLLPGDALFLCNPNNPVGNLLSLQELMKIIQQGEEAGAFVVVDESFRDFVRDMPSVIPYVQQSNNLIVVYSLTKFFALPGLRLGCVVAPTQVIGRLNSIRDPWGVNVLAQIAGRVAVRQRDYINRSRELIAREKEWLFARLNSIPGIKPFFPRANYIFIDIRETGLTSTALRRLLIEEGIIVRDCETYPTLNSGYIRVAVRKRGENERLAETLVKVLKENCYAGNVFDSSR